MKKLKDISIVYKLLGIYLLGLFFLGIAGYGSYIYIEYNLYRNDIKLFKSMENMYEKIFFEHSKYLNDLYSILKKIYYQQQNKETLIKDFLKKVNSLKSNRYIFALVKENGELLLSNSNYFKKIINSTQFIDYFNSFSKYTNFENRIYLTLNINSKPVYIIGRYFKPINCFILSTVNHDFMTEEMNKLITVKRNKIIKSIVISFLVGIIATLIVLIVLYFYLKKLVMFINNMRKILDQLITKGRTEEKLEIYHNDELGKMIKAFNKYLENKFKLEKFRQLIEEDEDIYDVYMRIASIIKDIGDGIFTIYEVDTTKNRLNDVQLECHHLPENVKMEICCSEEIFIKADSCRAKRLAQIIKGHDDYQVCPRYKYYNQNKIHLCIPIIIAGTTGNIIHITTTKDNSKKLRMIEEYIRYISPVIESKKLLQNMKNIALKDALTGLNNRRFLEEYLDILLSEVKRYNQKLGLLMCDLDYFKKVNDEYGHEAGDKVLKIIADTLRNSVRGCDLVIRYGGEEFLVILKNVREKEDVVLVAEKIRKNIELIEMEVLPGVIIKKTISVGVAIFPDDAENFWQGVKYADVALYKAKELGRNKVVKFEKEMWQEGEEY